MYNVEKILNELEKHTFSAEVYNDDFDGTEINNLICLGDVKEVIEDHINDGWIILDDKLPEVGQYVLGTNKYGEILMYSYGWNAPHTKKTFFNMCGTAADIIAWMPLPEEYRTKRSEGE